MLNVNNQANKKNLIIIANAALGKGMSGSDRIFIELSKKLKNKLNITVCVWEEGFEMCQRQGLIGVTFSKWFLGSLRNLPFAICYFYRIISGIYYAFKLNIPKEESKNYFIYSASDFFQDFIPFLVLKIRYPKARFISSLYLAAPNPIFGYRKEYEKKIQIPKLKDIYFYFSQLLPKFLIPKISNYIFVTSKPDKDYFIKKGFNSKKIIVITGGVDFNKYKDFSAPKEKEFDCIFYGRFHPQKGVIEIIDIWKILVTKLPKAKLAMIGDGPLFNDVKQKISEYGLDKNIFLKGHMDDSTEKLRIFGSSKIVVHPAVYDSGGMASAEVMYLKIPGISFDLDSLKTYYPKGMLKVEKFNFNKFSETILKLLNDKKLYDQLAIQAKECVLENFSWDKKAQELLDQVFDN